MVADAGRLVTPRLARDAVLQAQLVAPGDVRVALVDEPRSPAQAQLLQRDGGEAADSVAAVVSAIAPLFVLVLFFQRQIVSGLTAGAVKG